MGYLVENFEDTQLIVFLSNWIELGTKYCILQGMI